MNFTLRSASSSFNQENERLTRKRPTTTSTTTTTTALNRFLSFNENKSSSAENRRRSFQVNIPPFEFFSRHLNIFPIFSSQHQI